MWPRNLQYYNTRSYALGTVLDQIKAVLSLNALENVLRCRNIGNTIKYLSKWLGIFGHLNNKSDGTRCENRSLIGWIIQDSNKNIQINRQWSLWIKFKYQTDFN